jgi:integrase/recombinase XerC
VDDPTLALALVADVDLYLAQRGAADLSARSVRHHRCILYQVARLCAARGHRRWSTVTPADLDAVLLDLSARGLRRSSRDSCAWSLRSFGAWLAARGRVLRDPAADLHVADDDEIPLPPAPLTEEQVATLINGVPSRHVVDLRIRLHLEILYSCGLRNAEAVHLDVADLDLDDRTILVRAGKGGRSRILPLLAGTLAAAGAYLAVRRELLSGPDTGPLFLSPRGQRLGAWWIQRWLAGASHTLGFHVHPHLLRHSIAVHLLRRGADIRHIQQFLGHADLETTKIYLRLVPGHLREDYDRAMPVLLAADMAIVPTDSQSMESR